MLVFYSGWGYWEYDTVELQRIIKEDPIKVNGVFTLPNNDAENEGKSNYKRTTSFLFESSEIEHPESVIPILSYPDIDEDLKFILCEKWQESFSYSHKIDSDPIRKMVAFTKDDFVESFIDDEESKSFTATASIKLKRTRTDNLKRAIDAAINALGKKPSFDELWQYFQDDKDETDIIEDTTDDKITWVDTKGKLKDIKKTTLANRLSRIKQ